ncbi:MAG TPA: hypothetical protein VHA75_02415 [Rugosimonospora sp.]|jgi:hypothetical protein|nr:hypothetical protein [Rugosimonospora sp.]
MIDPDLAAEWVVDDAIDAGHDDPFAGDEPPEGWVPEPMRGDAGPVGSAFVADARRTDAPS